MSKLRLIFLIILIPIAFFECEKNNPVPDVYVYFEISLYNPLYQALRVPLSPVVIPNEGNKGIIVIQTEDQAFVAYDATCTYDPSGKWGKVVPDATGIFAKDTVCGSKFSLFYDGNVYEGPAKFPLKMYVVDYNPNKQTLLIHN